MQNFKIQISFKGIFLSWISKKGIPRVSKIIWLDLIVLLLLLYVLIFGMDPLYK